MDTMVRYGSVLLCWLISLFSEGTPIPREGIWSSHSAKGHNKPTPR